MPAYRLAVVAALAVSAACGGGATSPSAPAGTSPAATNLEVSGRILEYVTGEPIPGVTVRFGNRSAVSGPGGLYELTLAAGPYEVMADGAAAGSCEVTRRYRGDFLVRSGTCIGRYGTVSDGQTLTPLRGATVTLGAAAVVTDDDGWYRIDFGCSPPWNVSTSTAYITATRVGYKDRSIVAGKGVVGVSRIDLQMQPR